MFRDLREGGLAWLRGWRTYTGLSLVAHLPLLAYAALRSVQHATLERQDLRATAVVSVCLAALCGPVALGAVESAATARARGGAAPPLAHVAAAARTLRWALAIAGVAAGLLVADASGYRWRWLRWPRPEAVLGVVLVWLALVARFLPRALSGKRPPARLRAAARERPRIRPPRAGASVFLALALSVAAHLAWTGGLRVYVHGAGWWLGFVDSDPTPWVPAILIAQVVVLCPLLGVIDAVAFGRARRQAEDLARVFD